MIYLFPNLLRNLYQNLHFFIHFNKQSEKEPIPSSPKQITSARSPPPETVESDSPKRSGTPSSDTMSACKTCGRNFNADRLEKHELICQKTAAKKRKTFDATSHRIKVRFTLKCHFVFLCIELRFSYRPHRAPKLNRSSRSSCAPNRLPYRNVVQSSRPKWWPS